MIGTDGPSPLPLFVLHSWIRFSMEMDIYFTSRSTEPSAVIAEDDNGSIYIFHGMIGSVPTYHTTASDRLSGTLAAITRFGYDWVSQSHRNRRIKNGLYLSYIHDLNMYIK